MSLRGYNELRKDDQIVQEILWINCYCFSVPACNRLLASRQRRIDNVAPAHGANVRQEDKPKVSTGLQPP